MFVGFRLDVRRYSSLPMASFGGGGDVVFPRSDRYLFGNEILNHCMCGQWRPCVTCKPEADRILTMVRDVIVGSVLHFSPRDAPLSGNATRMVTDKGVH